jgi:NAD(P)-dependent dehydrogenase (short-subunit alcohol dehydrogenase family)
VSGTVLVTGASGGLGGAVVRALLDDGRRVAALVRSEAARERLAAELAGAGELDVVTGDLLEADGPRRAVAAAEAAGGGLAAVVNLVGGFSSGPLVHETDPAELDRLLRLNLVSGFALARAALPRLVANGGGAWVGVGARAALRPFPGAAAYVAAKAAAIAFVQALDADYRGDGVRANAILPSVIDTPANRAAMPDADHSRWVAPDEVARVVRFLVSDESAPTSGAAIPVYGRA